jgi:hypothetical protein
MKAPTLPHRRAIYDALRLYCNDNKNEGSVAASAHPRALVLQQALGHSDEDGLPESVWSVAVALGLADAPAPAPDLDDTLLALGGNLDPEKCVTLTAEQAAPIGRAIVFALNGPGPQGEALQKPRLGSGAQMGTLIFHGGHLRRSSIGVCPGVHDRSPLAWAVVCWLALRPLGKSERNRDTLDPPAKAPVMLTHVTEDGVRRSIWGEFTPADLRRHDRRFAAGDFTGAQEDGEATEAQIQAWMAAAEHERDVEALLLDDEDEHLKAAAQALGAEVGSGHDKEAQQARRRQRWAKDLLDLRPNDPRRRDARARVVEALKIADRWRTMPDAWRNAIVAAEAEAWTREGAAVEVARWQGWPALERGEGDGWRKSETAARRAAWHLRDGGADEQVGALLRQVAAVGLEAACKRLPCETEDGQTALTRLWVSLGYEWRLEHASGSDGAWRAKHQGSENPLIAVPTEQTEEAARACRRALRVAIERAVGLAVELVATDEEARRLVCGPEVAARIGRGQVAVVAERPPRVIIGALESLALAGLKGIELDGGVLVVTGSAHEKWSGEESAAIWQAAVKATRRALGASEVPTLTAIAEQIAPRLEDPEGGRWRPALDGGRPFEWLRLPLDGAQGVETRLRWRHEDTAGELLVEVTLRRAGGEYEADARAWSAGVELDLDPQALVLEEWLATAESFERALPAIRGISSAADEMDGEPAEAAADLG